MSSGAMAATAQACGLELQLRGWVGGDELARLARDAAAELATSYTNRDAILQWVP